MGAIVLAISIQEEDFRQILDVCKWAKKPVRLSRFLPHIPGSRGGNLAEGFCQIAAELKKPDST